MAKAKDYINLEMPSILGMGAVGPTLAVLTASVYQALETSMEAIPAWAYPITMLILASLLAVFPTAQTKFPMWQKACVWPLAAIVIFSAAWGTNHGLSSGVDAIEKANVRLSFPSLVPSAYAQEDSVPEKMPAPITNKVDFAKLDMSTKTAVPDGVYNNRPDSVRGISWPGHGDELLDWIYLGRSRSSLSLID